jgi:hypothetical protein
MPIIPISGSAAPRGALVPIGTFVSDGTTAGTTFNNIPQGYRDLMLVVNGGATRAVANDHMLIAFNTNTSSNYSYTYLTGDGSATAASRSSGGAFAVMFNCLTGLYSPANFMGSGVAHFPNYSNTTTYKNMISKCGVDNNGSGQTTLTTNTFTLNTVAITNLYCITYTNMIPTTTLTLYGVRSVGQ